LPDGRSQTVIFCADAPGSREVVEIVLGPGAAGALAVSRTTPVVDGIGVRDGFVCRFHGGEARRLEPLEHLSLPGAFNLENAAAACLAAEAIGADAPHVLRALAEFKGLPHRLERVGTVRGVACYNDSYATRPDATIAAIGAFDLPLALILGGSEKHADFRGLADALCRHRSLQEIHLIGATAGRLQDEIGRAATRAGHAPPPCSRHPGLPEAFEAGLAGLHGNGVLLMSPACASFGLFPNYKVRGERFKALVHAAQGAAARAAGPCLRRP
jgi:UDP-N-acetylmuramoylalanine-D-glutamate ligase